MWSLRGFVILALSLSAFAENDTSDNLTTTTATTSSTFTSTSSTGTTSTRSTLTSSTSTTSSRSSTWTLSSTTNSTTTTLSTTSNFTTTTETNTSTSSTSRTTSSSSTTTRTHSQTSSTRTSSTVSSTTSTSSTTTFVYKLYIVEAELSPEILRVYFNYPARLANENDTWQCDDLWKVDSVRAFGLDPSCQLSSDRLTLEVMLGPLARLQVGQRVSMHFGVLLVADVIVVEPTELSQLVSTRWRIVPLQPVLLSADAIQGCSTGSFSLAESTGFARRAPVIEWRLGNRSESLRELLGAAFDEANRLMLQILRIPPDALHRATKQGSWELEVVASIGNWQGEQSQVSAVVTVLDIDAPLLQILPSSMKRFYISNFQEVEMEVAIFPPAPHCGHENYTVDMPQQQSVQWEYLQQVERPCSELLDEIFFNSSENFSSNASENGSENLSNASNWSNFSPMEDMEMINAPCFDLVWQRIENLSFVNLNRRPGSLRLPAFSFEPNSRHEFRAVVTFQGYMGPSPAVLFMVQVAPRGLPVAQISGPREVSAHCPFELSAAKSYDASSPEQQLDYAWSCWQGAVNDTSGEPCEVNVTDWSSARLEVEALEEGSYSFRLQVWSRNSSRMADAWWWVRVRRRRIPLVVGQVPWSSGGLVSVRAPVAPAIGHVFGSAACPMPVGWSWHWLLTGDDYILAILNTSVQSLGSSLEVRSSDFRGHLLTPEESYGYALMGLSPGEPRPLAGTRLPPDGFVWRSDSFWADAPPVDGLLELQPSSGEALITAFTASTFGWQDRQEAELSYAFFRFPLRSTGVWADGRGGLILEESFKWSMPAIDWSNSLSSRYFRRQGGLALRTWDANRRVADLLMAAGEYFIVVRARDPQGGEATAAVLGPVVVEPVNATDLRDVLEASFTSQDAEQILNTVVAVGPTAPPDAVLDALQLAVSILEPSPTSLEKLCQVLAAVAPGGEVLRAADVLDAALKLAVSGRAVQGFVALAMLETLGAVNQNGRTSGHTFAKKMLDLASQLGEASKQLSEGELFLSGVSEGRGVALQLVARPLSALVTMSLEIERLYMPPSLLMPASRRLQGCSEIDIKITYWTRSNPYAWAELARGMNQYVLEDATVAVLQLEACGSLLSFNETIPDRALRLRSITLPPRRPPPRGFEWDVICTRWSESELAWVTSGVEVEKPVYWDSVEVSCVVYDGLSGLAVTAVFFPLEVTTSSTTELWVPPSYTTFEIPTVPPAYVVSCNESLLPDPPRGQSWNCSKPGEGQECRATCKGYTDEVASITCLKGMYALQWFVTNICPEFTTTTLDLTVDKPSENAFLGTVLVIVWVLVFCCSACVASVLAYGIYKLTMNQPSKGRTSRVSRVSRVSMAPVEVEETRSREILVANESDEEVEVKETAFTQTAEIQYNEDWKTGEEWKVELESILSAQKIPLETEGRLYYVENSFLEVIKVKDLQKLPGPKKIFPLSIMMQEAPPQVEKADAFHFWQVEWGAMRGTEMNELTDLEVTESTEQQIQAPVARTTVKEDRNKLRQAADPVKKGDLHPKRGRPSEYPVDPLQKVLDRSKVVQKQTGHLAATAAQASVYVPELQEQLYKELAGEDVDDGWLEVRSPSGRVYYWNQFTYEEWEPAAKPMELTMYPE